jgi:hypothetical protein
VDNVVPITSKQFDSTDSWTNAGNGTWSAMNSGNAAWKFEIIQPFTNAAWPVRARNHATMGGTAQGGTAIAIDSTSAIDRAKTTIGNGNGAAADCSAEFSDYPSTGYHYIQSLNTSFNSGGATWYGDNGGTMGGGTWGINSGMFVEWFK